MSEIRFAWVCRNKKFDEISRVELTDEMLLNGSRPSWITSDNCEIVAKILPTGRKDKNGRELYEGDIAKNNTIVPWVFEVRRVLGETGYRFGWFSLQKNIFVEKGGEIQGLPFPEQIEYIGNIYENPEVVNR